MQVMGNAVFIYVWEKVKGSRKEGGGLCPWFCQGPPSEGAVVVRAGWVVLSNSSESSIELSDCFL